MAGTSVCVPLCPFLCHMLLPLMPQKKSRHISVHCHFCQRKARPAWQLGAISIGNTNWCFPDRKHSKKRRYAECRAYQRGLLCFTAPATSANLREEQNSLLRVFREVRSLVKREVLLFNPNESAGRCFSLGGDRRFPCPHWHLSCLGGSWVRQDESSLQRERTGKELLCGFHFPTSLGSERGIPFSLSGENQRSEQSELLFF